ncbi:MAG: hypothetical protein V1822_02915 [Candidatus Micrarchaeota archaeon]
MGRAFFLFILVSFCASLLFANILVSRPDAYGNIEILVEGGQNGSARLISPDGQARDISIVDGYWNGSLDSFGRWAVEFGGERVFAEYEPAGAGKKIEENNPSYGGALGILGAIFAAILFLGAGTYALSRFYAKEEGAQLFVRGNGVGEFGAAFVAGKNGLAGVEIFCGAKKMIGAKKLGAYERLEVKVEEGRGGKWMARYFEGGVKKEICGSLKNGSVQMQNRNGGDNSGDGRRGALGKEKNADLFSDAEVQKDNWGKNSGGKGALKPGKENLGVARKRRLKRA